MSETSALATVEFPCYTSHSRRGAETVAAAGQAQTLSQATRLILPSPLEC